MLNLVKYLQFVFLKIQFYTFETKCLIIIIKCTYINLSKHNKIKYKPINEREVRKWNKTQIEKWEWKI